MSTSEKKKSEESPPSDKSEKKKSEGSPPSDKPEEKKSEESPPSDKPEEKTSVEDPSVSPPQPKESKKSPPPADEDTDVLAFTSATEGEASSSAWELVPEKKIARKIGVKSDSELDHLIKKVVKEEAEQWQLTSPAAASAVTAAAAAAAVTSSSGATSTTVKDLFATIPEESAAEAAEAAGTKAEEEAADKPLTSQDVNWQEADFSFEDAPAPPSKESLTSGLSKRKGLSTSQGGAKKRALSLRPPRSSSAGPKLKAAPVAKSAKKIPRAASPHAKAVGKPAAKPPPNAITPLGKAAAAKPPPAAVTSKPPQGTVGAAWQAPAKGKAPPTAAERERESSMQHQSHLRCLLWTGASSPQGKLSWQRHLRCTSLTPTLLRDTIVMSAHTTMCPQIGESVTPSPTGGPVSIAGPITPSTQITRQSKRGLCTGGSSTVTPHAGCGATKP